MNARKRVVAIFFVSIEFSIRHAEVRTAERRFRIGLTRGPKLSRLFTRDSRFENSAPVPHVPDRAWGLSDGV